VREGAGIAASQAKLPGLGEGRYGEVQQGELLALVETEPLGLAAVGQDLLERLRRGNRALLAPADQEVVDELVGSSLLLTYSRHEVPPVAADAVPGGSRRLRCKRSRGKMRFLREPMPDGRRED
jgi:hypothetical protein